MEKDIFDYIDEDPKQKEQSPGRVWNSRGALALADNRTFGYI